MMLSLIFLASWNLVQAGEGRKGKERKGVNRNRGIRKEKERAERRTGKEGNRMKQPKRTRKGGQGKERIAKQLLSPPSSSSAVSFVVSFPDF